MPYVKGVGYITTDGHVRKYGQPYVKKSDQPGFVHGNTKHGRYAGQSRERQDHPRKGEPGYVRLYRGQPCKGKYIPKSGQPGFVHGNTKPIELRANGWKLMALKRDNYTCQKCGSIRRPHVHHIDGQGVHNSDHPNNNLDNLITLCPFCHFAVHYGHKRVEVERMWALKGQGRTLEEIGSEYGITRERVRQLLKRLAEANSLIVPRGLSIAMRERKARRLAAKERPDGNLQHWWNKPNAEELLNKVSPLMRNLMLLQKRLDLSDPQMANYLNISFHTWRSARAGKIKTSRVIARAAMAKMSDQLIFDSAIA